MIVLHPTTPRSAVESLVTNWALLRDLVARDFIGRYKGSALGVAWSLFSPILMLVIYTFVFSVAFKARWGTGDESRVSFAIVFFSGMIVHGMFADCLNRAPTLIISHANFVKKVIFPLDILPWMVLLSALLHFGVGLLVLLVFCFLAGVPVYSGTVLVPVVLVPVILTTLGLTWILASLGVYLRDLAQAMGMVTTVALFVAPVFYPVEVLPEPYRSLISWNPITLPIIQLRELVLWDRSPDWAAWGFSLILGLSCSALGYWWFQRTRKGFADVL